MPKQILSEEILGKVKEQFEGVPSPQTYFPPSQEGERVSEIGESYSRSLDDAATLLLNILTPSIRDYATELADITLKIPRWQLLLGSLLSQYEGGNLTAPSIDPSWRQIEIAIGKSHCLWKDCGREFTPRRLGEKFCSPLCGDNQRRVDISLIRKRREEEIKQRKREGGDMRGEIVS